MRFLLGLLRLLAGLLILASSLLSILALVGFAAPFFDLFNHLQLLLFIGTLFGLIAVPLLGITRIGRGLAIVGFLASAWTFVPEWVSSFAPRPAATPAVTTLKLMTHNLFGLNYDMDRVAAVIAAEDPDIIALQEYFPEQQRLDELLRPKYPFAVRCQGGKRANLGLYSKIPFDKEMSSADCPNDAYGTQRTAHITAGFTLGDGTHFSVLTTHMDWPFPIARQEAELQAVEAEVKAVAGPLLVVGDFNSTPWSYALKRFEAATGLTRETRNLITYPLMITVPERISRSGLLNTIPFLALDQVYQRGIIVSELHRGPETGSDHLPVIFTFSVPKG